MNCGFSLPINYLTGSPLNAEDFVFQEHFKDPLAFMNDLKKAGVSSIELRHIEAETETEKAALAAKQILDSELEVTIHGYLPQAISGDRFADILPPIASIVETLKERKASCTMTFHSYKARNGDLSQLSAYNADFIKNLMQIIYNENLPLKIALEINRNKGFTDPSIDYDGLMTVWKDIASPQRVGFCWDFGHSYWNTSKGYMNLIPKDDFLAHVIHTHIHDVSPEGETHWPLTEGVIPLNDFVARLNEQNYTGTYNLELSPERWHKLRDVKTCIFESISILKAKVG